MRDVQYLYVGDRVYITGPTGTAMMPSEVEAALERVANAWKSWSPFARP